MLDGFYFLCSSCHTRRMLYDCFRSLCFVSDLLNIDCNDRNTDSHALLPLAHSMCTEYQTHGPINLCEPSLVRKTCCSIIWSHVVVNIKMEMSLKVCLCVTAGTCFCQSSFTSLHSGFGFSRSLSFSGPYRFSLSFSFFRLICHLRIDYAEWHI